MPADTETGNPAPLGLVGFGLTTILLSTINAGLIQNQGATQVVVPLALAFGGSMQVLAGVLAYNEGDTFETVAFSSYGAFWWWFGLLELLGYAGVFDLTAATTPVIGLTLILWGVFTTYMWVASFKLNWAVWSVFLLLTITFYLLGFGDFYGMEWLVMAGGWVGIVTGAAAMYVSFAEVANWCFDDDVVPTGGTPIGD